MQWLSYFKAISDAVPLPIVHAGHAGDPDFRAVDSRHCRSVRARHVCQRSRACRQQPRSTGRCRRRAMSWRSLAAPVEASSFRNCDAARSAPCRFLRARAPSSRSGTAGMPGTNRRAADLRCADRALAQYSDRRARGRASGAQGSAAPARRDSHRLCAPPDRATRPYDPSRSGRGLRPDGLVQLIHQRRIEAIDR